MGFRLVLLAALFSACAWSQCPSSVNVGYSVQTFSGVKTGIWYPTSAAEGTVVYGSTLSGRAARDGALNTCGRFPLIVFSHGDGGCGTQSAVLTETLARQGFIVAAPDHRDAKCSVDGGTNSNVQDIPDSYASPQTWTDQSAVERRNDVRAVVDGMLGSQFANFIDRDRIAGMGHSLGGYTMFGMIGGWDSWRDARFKAAVLLSPWIQPYLVQGRIPRANPVPVMYQGGTLDLGITPSLEQAGGAYDSNQVPKFFLELRSTGHLGWTNSACGRTATTVAACLASDTNLQLSSRNLNDFFDRYLRGNTPRFLFDKSQPLATYRRNTMGTTVSGASFASGAPVAPDSIASLFGDAFTTTPVFADRLPLPTSLGQIASITILDSRNRTFQTQLFFASPGQVNYLLPEGVAPGIATLTVRDATDVIASGTINVDAVAPGFFTARSNGAGAPAGQILTIRPDGSRIFTDLSDANGNPTPIDLTQGEVILILYGTGLRSAAAAQATIAGVTVPTFGLARSAQFLGLDQLNVGPLPNTLQGAGPTDLVLTLDNRRANTMQVNIR